MLRADVVSEARRWLGTPFAHQGNVLGQGVDCAQLVLEVAIALGGADDPGVSFRIYGRIPRPAMMRSRLQCWAHQIPADDARDGDIVWIWIRAGIPMHLGILTPVGLLHADAGAGRVVEIGFGSEMRRRVNSYWRYNALED